MNHFKKSSSEGQILIIVVIIVLVTFGLIVGSLYNTRLTQKLSADFRGKKSLEYKAEEGINRALSIFVRQAPNDSASDGSQTDLAPFSGNVSCDKNGNRITVDAGADTASIDCAFIAEDGLNVTVVRKPDHCRGGKVLDAVNTSCEAEPDPDQTDARIFLVNSRAFDKSGRSYLMQAVFVAPRFKDVRLSGSALVGTNTAHPYQKPYIASILRGGEHQIVMATPTSTPKIPIGEVIEKPLDPLEFPDEPAPPAEDPKGTPVIEDPVQPEEEPITIPPKDPIVPPEDPVTPEEITGPEIPSEPAEPVTPIEPEEPAAPEEITGPEIPSEPAEPIEPEEPISPKELPSTLDKDAVF